MKKLNITAALLSCLWLFAACEKETTKTDSCTPDLCITNRSTLQEDNIILQQLITAINEYAGASTCSSSDQWGITPIGIKACGGPAGYIAYNKNIDVNCFLEKVNHYTKQSNKYNRKHGIFSDCSLPTEPKAVKCENGKPVFVY